jgi:hypothetical protein
VSTSRLSILTSERAKGEVRRARSQERKAKTKTTLSL